MTGSEAIIRPGIRYSSHNNDSCIWHNRHIYTRHRGLSYARHRFDRIIYALAICCLLQIFTLRRYFTGRGKACQWSVARA